MEIGLHGIVFFLAKIIPAVNASSNEPNDVRIETGYLYATENAN